MKRASPATLAVAVILALSGCAKDAHAYGPQSGSADETTVRATGESHAGDVDRGKVVFATNCSTCHGEDGKAGGVGPSLIDEGRRQNYARTIVWIENPAPPMPTLYPSPLSERDVEDVAAFVQQIR